MGLKTINHGLIGEEVLVVALVLSKHQVWSLTAPRPLPLPQLDRNMASVWRWRRTLERTLNSNITASLGFIFCHEHYFVWAEEKSDREDSFAPFSSVTLLSKTCSKVWVGALSCGDTCRLVLVQMWDSGKTKKCVIRSCRRKPWPYLWQH